jgi:hypothetical protein
MQLETEQLISKWWLRGVVFLLATSPPAIVLWFQDGLVPYLAALPIVVILRVIAVLLLTTTALFAFLILQRPWLRWDEPTGTWASRLNGLRYCGTCRAKKIIVPLKNEITGWRCVSCGNFRPDPARAQPESRRSGVVRRERI